KLAIQALAAAAPRAMASVMMFHKALSDKEAPVARQAAIALASLPADLALEGLLAALDHADAEVLKTAGDALDKFTWDKGQVKKLGELLRTTGAGGRTRLLAAVASLGADGADALPALRERLKKGDAKEQQAIVAALGK